jgi:hypothetical protein
MGRRSFCGFWAVARCLRSRTASGDRPILLGASRPRPAGGRDAGERHSQVQCQGGQLQAIYVGRHGDPHVSHLHDGSQPAGISDQYSGRPVHSADRHGVRKKIRGQIVSRAAIQGAVTRVVIAVLFATEACSFTQVQSAAQDRNQTAQFCVPPESDADAHRWYCGDWPQEPRQIRQMPTSAS